MPSAPVPDFANALRETGITWDKLNLDAPALRRTKLSWSFQDTDNAALKAFRQRFDLDRVIEHAQDEWHAIRLLRNWVYLQNVRGGNDLSTQASGGDAETLLLAINAGGEYWCTFFAIMTQSVMQTMGFPARHVGISCEYDRFGKSTHHGVAEVWVNQFRKWVLLDTHFNTHFSLDGVVLDAYQIHRAALAGRGKEILTHKGPDAMVAASDRTCTRSMDEADAYFWRYCQLRNTPFTECGSWEPGQLALLTDESHKGITWWQNGRKKHVGYSGGFVETQDVSEVYFDLNTVYLEPQVKRHQIGLLVCNVGTFTPNLDKLEVRLDNGAWQPQSTWSRVQWWVHPGDNVFELRTVNKSGRRGPITRLEALGVKHPIATRAQEPALAGKS